MEPLRVTRGRYQPRPGVAPPGRASRSGRNGIRSAYVGRMFRGTTEQLATRPGTPRFRTAGLELGWQGGASGPHVLPHQAIFGVPGPGVAATRMLARPAAGS